MKKFIFFTILMLCGLTAAQAEDVYDSLARTAQKMRVEKNIAEKLAVETRKSGYSEDSVGKIRDMIAAGKYSAPEKYAEKVLEGIAKKAPEEAVVRAAEQIRSRYETAERITRRAGLSAEAEQTVTDAVADAITAGAKEQGLMKAAEALSVKESEKNETAVASMMLYREMVRYGVPDEKASEVAEKAVRSLSGSEIHGYRKNFSEQAGYMNSESLAERMGHDMSGSHGSGGSGSSGGGHGGGSGSGGSGGHGGSGGNGKGGH